MPHLYLSFEIFEVGENVKERQLLQYKRSYITRDKFSFSETPNLRIAIQPNCDAMVQLT
jgi:hypothetical protein